MAKMTFLWLVGYFGGLLLSVINPLYGLLTYLFEYYLRPSLHWWGTSLPDLRWNLIVSIVLLLTFLLRRNSLTPIRPISNPALKWLLALGAIMLVMTPSAADVAASWELTVVFLKFVLLYALIIGVIRTEKGFDAFGAVHIAGATWWGWEVFKDPKRVDSRLLSVGSSDTLGDNFAAIHLLGVLPFIVVYLLTAKDKRLRALCVPAVPLVINTFILCNSRGALIGLIAAAIASIVLIGRGRRLRLVGILGGVALTFLTLADPEFIMRQRTTTNYENEATAIERVESWRGSLRLIRDYPLGAGGRGFDEMSPKYLPEVVERHDGQQRAPHNTYVLIVSEWGIPGLFVFLGFIGSTFGILHRIRAHSTGSDGFFYRSLILQTALVGTLTAAFFADRLYGESIYWLCALTVALYRVQHAAASVQLGEAAARADSRQVFAPVPAAASTVS